MDLIFETMTLGEVINDLKAMPPEFGIQFDFCGLWPNGLHSYRGFYEHLAVSYIEPSRHESPKMTVGDFLKECQAALGATFHGWKGGGYRMDTKTPMWVDMPSDCTGTAIKEIVRDFDFEWVRIVTGPSPAH